MRYTYVSLTAFVLSALAAGIIYLLLPSYRYVIGGEDNLVENVTAALYLCVFLFGLALFIKLGKHKWHALLSVVGLVGFLEELSYGERLLGLSMPVITGVKMDGVHDVFFLVFQRLASLLGGKWVVAIVLFVVTGAVLVAAVLVVRRRVRETADVHRDHSHYVLGVVFLFFASAALLLDLGIVRHSALRALEELLELNVAFTLVLWSMSIYEAHAKAHGTVVRQRPLRTAPVDDSVDYGSLKTPQR